MYIAIYAVNWKLSLSWFGEEKSVYKQFVTSTDKIYTV